MAIIQIDRLEAGMVLKSGVCDRSGRLLLPDGSELADKHLKIFRMWGVTEADIMRGPDDAQTDDEALESGTTDPQILAEAEQTVAKLFRHNDPQHPMIRVLMRICLERSLADVG